MKTLSSGILLAAMAATLAGCAPADKFFHAEPASIETGADSENISVAVESSSSWIFDASFPADWLTLRYDDDDPNLLSVSVATNESLGERTDSIVLVSGEGSRLIIPLRQLAMDVRFDVSPTVPEPFGARDDTPRILTVSTNLTSGWNYTLLNAAEWLTVVPGEEDEGNLLTVNAEHIFSLYERRDTIVIRPTNEAFAALADSIAVVQAGLDLLVGSGSMDQQTRIITIPAEGGETLLSVWSRSPWSVGTEAAAEKVSIDLTEGGADMENGIPVVVTVAPDTGAEEYTFTLVFDSDGEKYEYQFVQAAAEPENPEPEPENPEPQPTSK